MTTNTLDGWFKRTFHCIVILRQRFLINGWTPADLYLWQAVALAKDLGGDGGAGGLYDVVLLQAFPGVPAQHEGAHRLQDKPKGGLKCLASPEMGF